MTEEEPALIAWRTENQKLLWDFAAELYPEPGMPQNAVDDLIQSIIHFGSSNGTPQWELDRIRELRGCLLNGMPPAGSVQVWP